MLGNHLEARSTTRQCADRSFLWLALGMVMVVAIGSGCTANPPRRNSPQTAGSQADRSNIADLDAKVAKAMLNVSELPIAVPKEMSDMFRVGHGLQHACNAELITDRRNVTDTGKGWSSAGDLPVVDQFVVAYDQPVAAQAVVEAKDAITCQDYSLLGVKVMILGLVDIGDVPSGGRMFVFCESVGEKANAQCTIVAGGGALACSVRGTARKIEEANALVYKLLPLVKRNCLNVVS